jgi:class 3 adenylate cyclase
VLVRSPGTPEERSFPFREQIVIGRRRTEGGEGEMILLRDPVVSGRHCVLTCTVDGHFVIRDVSRNGTRVSGRRLVPNVEEEIRPGERIQVGPHEFLLQTDVRVQAAVPPDDGFEATQLLEASTEVSILVGDIHGYTRLNQRHGASDVFANVSRVFAHLEAVVHKHLGAIKEYQGDAIFAYWESQPGEAHAHACRACGAALALDERLQQLAADPDVWSFPDVPLRMEWAVTTGSVLLSSMGRERPVGLAMVGDVVNYAFRLEKLAGAKTGVILVCERTEALCRSAFRFRDLGPLQVEGRARAEPVFVLEGRNL